MDKGFTADDVRAALGEGVLGVSGSLQRPVIAPAPLDRIVPGALTFCRHGGERLDQALVAAAGATLICAEPREIGDADVTLLAVENPRLGFIRAVTTLFSVSPLSGIDPTARVGASARIDPTASIGAYAVIGESCVVGPGSVLHPHVVLYPKVRIGAGVVVHAGTVIGADGFGYERNDSGDLEKFPHFGGVVIEDDVEIGSNTSIDRGTLGDTVIGAGSRIDNQVHIAHNVVLGRSVVVIAQSMIGGGVRIGDRAWVAPSASILNQITVGEGAVIGLGAVVVKHVEAGVTVMGVPAVPADRFKAGRKTP